MLFVLKACFQHKNDLYPDISVYSMLDLKLPNHKRESNVCDSVQPLIIYFFIISNGLSMKILQLHGIYKAINKLLQICRVSTLSKYLY